MKHFVFFVCLSVLLFSCDKDKIGFVNIGTLISSYHGAIDLDKKIKSKMDAYTKEKDSIYQYFQRELSDYQKNYAAKNSPNSKKRYNSLADKSEKIEKYIKSKEQMLMQENTKLTDSIADWIRGFIKNYGKTHSYTFVLGQNQTANLLYGDSSNDITQEILKLLNDEYNKPKK